MGHKLSPVLKSRQYNYHCKQGLECTTISNGKNNFTCISMYAEKSSLMVKPHCENELFLSNIYNNNLLTRLLKTEETFSECQMKTLHLIDIMQALAMCGEQEVLTLQ